MPWKQSGSFPAPQSVARSAIVVCFFDLSQSPITRSAIGTCVIDFQILRKTRLFAGLIRTANILEHRGQENIPTAIRTVHGHSVVLTTVMAVGTVPTMLHSLGFLA